MKITKLNFDDEYDNILKLIERSQFISFDCEMSGINSSDDIHRHRRDDNANERYIKMKYVASKYSLIQVGICCFILDDNDQKLKAHPYVFYLFPENSYDDIVMSVSSIDFLKKNNMDFQEWIKNGITFTDSNNEANWITKLGLDEKQKDTVEASNDNKVELTELKDITFFERNINNLKAMIDDPNKTEFTFDFCNAFVRKYIYQYMEANHPTISLVKTQDNKLQALKISHDEIITMKKKQLHKVLGFRNIWKSLSNKIIVGHNCFYDLLFMMKYFDGPLNDDLDAFKQRFNSLFPYVFDTKFLSSTGILGTVYSDTVLGELYNQLVTKNNGANLVEFGDKFSNDSNDKQLHDAGYDAFITGSIFWALISENKDLLDINNILETAKSACGNIIFNMNSLYHFDLDPIRSNGKCLKTNVFYLGGFTSSVRNNDINGIFTNAETNTSEYTVSEIIWINNESTFLALKGGSTTTTTEVVDISVLKSSIKLPDGWFFSTLEEFEAKKLIDKSKDEDILESPLKKQKV